MDEFLDLSKFTKQKKIGKGSFGQVYKVIEKGTENIFAAKVSLVKITEDKKMFLNLKREVSILSQLNHPSVLKFIGYSPVDFNQQSYPIIMTEYSPNGSLQDVIERSRRSNTPETWTDSKKLINLYGIASAMSYLHAHNIIHRDLKPANILEDENLFPKIADFGLSKINHQNANSMTSQSTIGLKGTPIYTAPEVWINNEYLQAGDVYAFSFIAYQLFELAEPFKEYDLNLLYKKVIIEGERPKFMYLIPACYRDLIRRCWSENPENRPTFQDIVKELRTNKEFIIDTINEDEFFEYVDFIDSQGSSFDPEKKLQAICPVDQNSREETISEERMESSLKEESFNEERMESSLKEEMSSEINNSVSIEIFNKLPIEKQRKITSSIIESETFFESDNSLSNINEFLNYLHNSGCVGSEENYFKINEEDPTIGLEWINQNTTKITLSQEAISKIYEGKSIENKEISEKLNKFKTISIELKYPSETFEEVYKEVLELKKDNKEVILINILINGLCNTDKKFRNNKNIHSVQFDNSVTGIYGERIGFKNSGGGSFYGCSSLTQVTIPSSVTSIGDYSFCGCKSLAQLTVPSSVTSVGKGAFSGCISLKQIKIPSSITNIESETFFGCVSLENISLPISLTHINDYAFSECHSLTRISFYCSFSEKDNYGEFKIETNDIFDILSAKLPEWNELVLMQPTINLISKNAFSECPLMIQIIIPSFVNTIKENTFNGCSSLTQITIPSSVTSIGGSAFNKCKSLVQITIPSSVKSIGSYAFNECSSLTQITIPSSVTSIGSYAFNKCKSLAQITIPSSVTSIDCYTFNKCSSLTQIAIPSSVTSIGGYAFNKCSNLVQITIPSSVISIRIGAFCECSSLKDISITSPLALIDKKAFEKCSLLEKIMIPSSVTKISFSAFCECSSLREITIPSSVTKILKKSFEGCSSLKQITIPSSVTLIGSYAFRRCSSLSDFMIPSSVTSIKKSVFENCSSLKQITIPSSVVSIEENAFCGCSSLMQVTIPSSVTKIEYFAFRGCMSLREVTIQSSAISIKKNSFEKCFSLTQITIPSSETSLGNLTFTGSPNDIISNLLENRS